MTVDNSDTQDNVETVATENTDVEGHEQVEQPQGGDQGDNGEEGKTSEPEKPKKSRAQERIEQLARKNAKLQSELDKHKSVKTDSEVKRPKIDDFEDYSKYEDALEEYHVAKAEQRVLNKLNESKVKEAEQKGKEVMESAVHAFAEEHEDFDAVVQAGLGRELPMPISLDELAKEFDYDPQTQIRLLYELAKDEEFHEQVSSVSKLKAARLLSERVDSWASPQQKNTVSKAPKPLNPVKANAPAKRDVYSLSDDEFLKARGLK